MSCLGVAGEGVEGRGGDFLQVARAPAQGEHGEYLIWESRKVCDGPQAWCNDLLRRKIMALGALN